MRRWASLLAILVLATGAVAATRTSRSTDNYWTAPDFAALNVRSIAMLPAAMASDNQEQRRLVEGSMGQSLRARPYRWISTLLTRDQVRRAGGDSLLKALNEQLLKTGRLDSLSAASYSRWTRARALLTVRIDRMERLELEFNQAGKPSTTVELTAALVDSTGRLLWSATGHETAEGPYQDPTTNPLGVKASGLNNLPMTNQGGAPSLAETLNRLLARWAPQFPDPPAAPAAE
jgi:hypothetical protein